MSVCPDCHRPLNEGNSPNEYECHDRDEESPTLCQAYAEVHRLRKQLDRLALSESAFVNSEIAARASELDMKQQLDEARAAVAELLPIVSEAHGVISDCAPGYTVLIDAMESALEDHVRFKRISEGK